MRGPTSTFAFTVPKIEAIMMIATIAPPFVPKSTPPAWIPATGIPGSARIPSAFT